jgi:hypothetical protein
MNQIIMLADFLQKIKPICIEEQHITAVVANGVLSIY